MLWLGWEESKLNGAILCSQCQIKIGYLCFEHQIAAFNRKVVDSDSFVTELSTPIRQTTVDFNPMTEELRTQFQSYQEKILKLASL